MPDFVLLHFSMHTEYKIVYFFNQWTKLLHLVIIICFAVFLHISVFLCIKSTAHPQGQMELKETVEIWKQKHGLMAYWRDSVDPKPKDFLSKFLDGHD